jgi:hypothetical protein
LHCTIALLILEMFTTFSSSNNNFTPLKEG